MGGKGNRVCADGKDKSEFVLHKNAPKAGAFGENLLLTEPLIPLHKYLALFQAVAAGGQAEL